MNKCLHLDDNNSQVYINDSLSILGFSHMKCEIDTGVYLLDFFCSGLMYCLVLISFLYPDLYVLEMMHW